jgi:hypothetical protein
MVMMEAYFKYYLIKKRNAGVHSNNRVHDSLELVVNLNIPGAIPGIYSGSFSITIRNKGEN